MPGQAEIDCPECNGVGYFLDDSYDHRGEHVQTETTCIECEGHGIVESYG